MLLPAPTSVLHVRADSYNVAAPVLGNRVPLAVTVATIELSETLIDFAGMAGSDDAGLAWGAGYESAARAAFSAAADVTNAATQVAALLEQTAINYAGAEAWSVPGESAVISQNQWSEAWVMPVDVPSAVGPGMQAPFGWSLVERKVGLLWPDGHQDLLRAAADAWQRAAQQVRSVSGAVEDAARDVLFQPTPESSAAFEIVYGVGRHVDDLATSFDGLAGSCTDYAEHVDKAHSAILSELKSFAEWSAGIETVGGIISAFTLGIAEVPTQGVEGGEIARAAKAIRDIIEGFLAAVEGVAIEARAVFAAAVQVARDAKPLLERVIERAKFAKVEQRDEELARVTAPALPPTEPPPLLRPGNPEEHSFIDLEERVDSFDRAASSWRTPGNLQRHFEDHAQDFNASTPEEYTEMATQFLHRAETEGLPMKVGRGGVVRAFDPKTNTFGVFSQDGKVITFYKPTTSSYWERQPGVLR